jgi:hypothetical protein
MLDQEVYGFGTVHTRETREGDGPLLTVETQANGDLWSTNEEDPSLVGFLSCLDCAGHWSPQYKILFLSYTISIDVSPLPSNLGRQSCRAACL